MDKKKSTATGNSGGGEKIKQASTSSKVLSLYHMIRSEYNDGKLLKIIALLFNSQRVVADCASQALLIKDRPCRMSSSELSNVWI